MIRRFRSGGLKTIFVADTKHLHSVVYKKLGSKGDRTEENTNALSSFYVSIISVISALSFVYLHDDVVMITFSFLGLALCMRVSFL